MARITMERYADLWVEVKALETKRLRKLHDKIGKELEERKGTVEEKAQPQQPTLPGGE